jgi:hypothetical protein
MANYDINCCPLAFSFPLDSLTRYSIRAVRVAVTRKFLLPLPNLPLFTNHT